MEPDLDQARLLVDKLEGYVSEAKAVPLTTQVRVDQTVVLAILEQLRLSLGAPA